ncbi:hypothetical protein [Sphingomicrobium flavum]|uniref:hypothetical protein n=1 Tax=Sphingomicrobium flavum TaxID=1229164 RepID=UPI0021ADEF85|nr:hypothetical protein [Sphingomicrobium flavum]
MRCKLIATGLGLTFLAAGCAPVDHGLGEAPRYNLAVQTINPDPEYPGGPSQPGDNGERAVGAVEAYREGNVQTSTGGMGGQRGNNNGGGNGGFGGGAARASGPL